MKILNVDVAVIGAGSAGLRAFRSARKWTDSVVLIESGPYGTTCARVGCMPSKLLIAAAEAAGIVAHAGEFGVRTGQVHIDGVAVMNRVRHERDRFVGFVVDGVHEIPDAMRLRGHARFIDDHRLNVGDDTLVEAQRIVIATGSSPRLPPVLAGLGDRVVVSDDIFYWTDLPRSVAVVGPGVIGIELGQALKRLGVNVEMFGKDRALGPLTDPKVSEAARQAIGDELHFVPDVSITSATRTAAGVSVEYRTLDGRSDAAEVDLVIAATGRAPNVDQLGLETTSLSLDAHGVPVFDPATMQIGDSHVFIAGDVTDQSAVLHEAADEGSIAGRNAGRFPVIEMSVRKSPMNIVFTDPQIAMVGARLTDLEGRNFVTGEASFEDQGRARVMLKNQGVMRVYADGDSGRFLGAEMIAPRAEHLAHLLAWSHQSQLTIVEMLDMPFYHPVVEEGLRTALRDAQAKLRQRKARAA